MKLEELVTELRENLLRDDAQLASGPSDQLWSDDTLVRYVNDAQQQFARKAMVLRDTTSARVCEIVLATGIEQYPLHASVIGVMSAKFDDEAEDLPRVGHVLLNVGVVFDPPWFDSSSAQAWPAGKTRMYSTDESTVFDSQQHVTLRVWPAPDADNNGRLLRLRVTRMPITPFTVEDFETQCELPEMHQLDMLEWAAYRALRTSDIDGASERADKHKARFDEAITEALRTLRQQTFAPMTWGCGAGGFSWSPR